MKTISIAKLALALIAFSSFVSAQQLALTAADYARAEAMLGYKTWPLVDRNGVEPNFRPDGSFWYQVLTPTGKEFVLINPVDGSRKTASSIPGLGLPLEMSLGSNVPNAVISPDGKRAVFIKDFNLWIKELPGGKETQLTTNGIKDFGYATDNAGWKHSNQAVLVWSPDSKRIATFQQDEREVSNSYLVSTKVGAPILSQWKSALPGDANVPMLHRVIIDVDAAKVTRLQVAPDPHRSTVCDDISCDGGGVWTDVQWSGDSNTLVFVSTTRDHKKVNLRVADAGTGAVREVYEETSPTQFESTPMGSGGNWRYLSATNEFIWYSESDGWGQLYLYDVTTGKLKNRITTGAFAVWNVTTVDEKNRVVYFEAGGREKGHDPYFSHSYSVGFDGKNLTLLTPENANHEVTWSPDGKYFIDNYSTMDKPTVSVLRDARGKLIANLEKADVSRLSATGWKAPMPITVKARDGVTDLYGVMYSPTKMAPGKKYPIINNIYPGPQGGSVGPRSFAPSRGDSQALAELGFVVVQIDGMCNPLRSKAFHDSCYGNMADNTLEDQIAGMKQLAAKYPYIDLDRVGVWGHSGGGFATAAAMFRYPDFFKVGISESGNHDNRNYEDDWGERYIGLLSGDNYKNQANQEFAKNLKGHLLLAHGTMDDNVPPGNTMLVVDALIKANKDFDLIMIPNARHGYGQASLYMMRRRWDYFVRHLLGSEPPKEYSFTPKQDPRMAK